jgi:hypothetical protein
MKVFISWSGDRSKRIASILYEWLPTIIQAIDPYYSKEEMPKGRRWSPELATELEQSNVGIIVLTPENLESTFIHFEAGALSKNQKEGRVSTMLFDVKETEVKSPLADFQNTKFTSDDVFLLMKNINALLNKTMISDKVLKTTFDKMWPDLEKNINVILASRPSSTKSVRDQKEMVEEILERTREISGKIDSIGIPLHQFPSGSGSVINQFPWVIGQKTDGSIFIPNSLSSDQSYVHIPTGRSFTMPNSFTIEPNVDKKKDNVIEIKTTS